jgi:Putative MetA-pathway of phenol degradation
MRLASSALACCLIGLAGAALSAEEAGLTLGAGLHYSQGNYGSDSTTQINSIVFSARYDTGRWTFRGTVPYLRVVGRAAVIPGIGRTSDTPLLEERKVSGFGDPVIAATYAAYYDRSSRFGVDVTGRLKIALGEPDDRLSTGEHDLGFQVDAFKTFDRVTAFAGLGYTIYGSTPLSPLENVFYYSLGGNLRLNERDSAGLSYDEREPVVAGGPSQREITLFGSRRFEGGWRAQTYFLLGLADGSPDWGAGVSFARSF